MRCTVLSGTSPWSAAPAPAVMPYRPCSPCRQGRQTKYRGQCPINQQYIGNMDHNPQAAAGWAKGPRMDQIATRDPRSLASLPGACFGRVADRVAAGNMALLGRVPGRREQTEQARLRNAIVSGALITAGRHLQHGDATQPARNMELFTNCASAVASFAKFYLLLNGSGVGRSYDDELIAVDWAMAPDLLLYLDPAHPDFPHDRTGLTDLGAAFGILPP